MIIQYLRNRSVSTRRTHIFALIRSNVFSRLFLKLELIYFTTVAREVLLLMSLVGTDVLRDGSIIWEDYAKLAFFLKTCMIF